VGAILERLHIPYVAAGSLASSLYGEPRSTDDIDLVADLRAPHLAPLIAALGDLWYVSEPAARDAIAAGGGSFNAIHIPSAVKVDFFVVGTDPFDAHRVATGRAVSLGAGSDARLRVDTAEHTVLRKLEWFRRGGETSERQWRDVVAVLRAQASALDAGELTRWASRLGVTDLLERAQTSAR
jgi:hypothetical protein